MNRGVYKKEEEVIKVFSENIRPDMTIYGGANDGLYVIELKSPSLDTYFMDSIHQNFKQLRHFCIAKQKASMLGIYSNLKKWIFTRYSLIDEIKTDYKYANRIIGIT